MRYSRRLPFLLISFFYVSIPGWSQQTNVPSNNWSYLEVQMDASTSTDVSSLIGLTLEGLFSRFGFPQSVYAVRGLEVWQDDVVFVYEDRDFYVYKNRVWQVEVKSAYGVKIGDRLGAVTQTLGEGAAYFDDYLLCPLPSRAWPLMLRINFNQTQTVSAIFIYRSDF